MAFHAWHGARNRGLRTSQGANAMKKLTVLTLALSLVAAAAKDASRRETEASPHSLREIRTAAPCARRSLPLVAGSLKGEPENGRPRRGGD